MARLNGLVFTAAVPFALSVAAALVGSPWLYVLLFLSHFVLLRFVPVFKGRESLWMFVMTAGSAIPVNIALLVWADSFGGVFLPMLFPLAVLRGALFFCILFGVEEIVMGIITRLIWKRQKKSIL